MAGISVVIPVWNGEKFIGAAIESVLKQSLLPAEIIVIDDGSTDRTADEVKRFSGVAYHFQGNQGSAVASNSGAKIATGEYLAFLDADDLWMAKKLERQLAIAEKHPDVELQFSWIENFLDDSLSEQQRAAIDFKPGPMPGIQKSTLFIRRNVFFKIGFFIPSASIDLLDWYARSKEMKIGEYMAAEVLSLRRIHGANQSILNRTSQNDFPKILKGILDRRRALP